MKNVLKIDKEQIKKLDFPKRYVVKDMAKRKLIVNKLNAAVHAKKDGDGKVIIVFKSKKRGYYKINGAVLMTGKEFIQLKGGYYLPVRSVVKVKFRTIK